MPRRAGPGSAAMDGSPSLPRPPDREEDMRAFPAAEADIHADDGVRSSHGAEAESVASFEIREIQVAAPGRNFSGVDEHGRVQRAPQRPAVLCLKEQQVPIAEAERAEAPQGRVGAV